jgi:GAF domain-containing protein
MKTINFDKIYHEIESLISKRSNELLQTICNKLKNDVYHYDWVGIYVLDQLSNTLILGPFAGKPTPHTHIKVGKGVCGQVAESGQTIVVQDVSKIDNYISCGLDVQSEIVVPIKKNHLFVAELDIDSHSPAPFTSDDEIFLNKICMLLAEKF